MFPDLIALLFFSRECAHRAHLFSDRHSEHVILQEFYEGVVDQIDALVETYQGEFGKVPIPYAYEDVVGSPADVLRQHLQVFRGCRKEAMLGNAALCALADEVEGLYQTTIYKLTNLG